MSAPLNGNEMKTVMNRVAEEHASGAKAQPSLLAGDGAPEGAPFQSSGADKANSGAGEAKSGAGELMTLVQVREQLKGVKGKRYWQSVDELAGTAEFQAAVEREFPSSAQEWVDPVSRRGFMKLMGASMGLLAW